MIPAAGFQSASVEDSVYTQMANLVKRELDGEGVAHNKAVNSDSIDAEALLALMDCVDILIQKLPRSQASLIEALSVGTLRNAESLGANGDIQVTMPKFGSAQVRSSA